MREPFGNVCAEAGFYGCPVVAARVDGLPEVVEDGRTGRLVAPSLPLSSYRDLGGGPGKMPSRVYDPDADALTSPLLVAPDDLARAVESLCDDSAAFGRASTAAHELTAEDTSSEPTLIAIGRLLERLAVEQERRQREFKERFEQFSSAENQADFKSLFAGKGSDA